MTSITGRVEVAGGGIAGMACAIALARRGATVRVHERRDELRDEGGMLSLAENAFRALDAIGIAQEVLNDGLALRPRDRQTGGSTSPALQTAILSAGRHALVVRSELHAALVRAARRAGVETRTGSTVVAAGSDGGLTIVDRDGRHEREADLVVGADGVGSRVRQCADIRVRMNDLHHYGMRGLVRYQLAESAHGQINAGWSGTKRLGYGRLDGERAFVYMSLPEREVADPAHPVDVEAWTQAYPNDTAIIRAVAEQGIDVARLFEVKCSAWSDGRIALIGDAAHAMPPHLGQGANLAMQDAVVLAAQLAGTGQLGDPTALRDALQRSEARLRAVVDPAQRTSVLLLRLQCWWPRPLSRWRASVVERLARNPVPGVDLTGGPDARAG